MYTNPLEWKAPMLSIPGGVFSVVMACGSLNSKAYTGTYLEMSELTRNAGQLNMKSVSTVVKARAGVPDARYGYCWSTVRLFLAPTSKPVAAQYLYSGRALPLGVASELKNRPSS